MPIQINDIAINSITRGMIPYINTPCRVSSGSSGCRDFVTFE